MAGVIVGTTTPPPPGPRTTFEGKPTWDEARVFCPTATAVLTKVGVTYGVFVGRGVQVAVAEGPATPPMGLAVKVGTKATAACVGDCCPVEPKVGVLYNIANIPRVKIITSIITKTNQIGTLVPELCCLEFRVFAITCHSLHNNTKGTHYVYVL